MFIWNRFYFTEVHQCDHFESWKLLRFSPCRDELEYEIVNGAIFALQTGFDVELTSTQILRWYHSLFYIYCHLLSLYIVRECVRNVFYIYWFWFNQYLRELKTCFSRKKLQLWILYYCCAWFKFFVKIQK